MDDAALIRASCLEVMGWKEVKGQIAENEFRMSSLGNCPFALIYDQWGRNWDPLGIDHDSWQMLDKLADEGLEYEVGTDTLVSSPYVYVQVGVESKNTVHLRPISPKNRRRAIVLSALKAKGVDVG